MSSDMPFQVVRNNPGNVAPDTSSYSVNSKIMIVAIVVLFGVVMFILGLHVYAKWFWRGAGAQNGTSGGSWRRRRRLEFAAGIAGQARSAGQVGLDEALVQKLPTFVFNQEKAKDGAMECAVCLEEFAEGEEGRLLPKCNHGFHIECIGIWLHSHSTCPLCRCSVIPDAPTDSSPAELSAPPREASDSVALPDGNPNVGIPGSGEVPQGAHGVVIENMPVIADSTEASAPRLSSSGISPKQVQYPANVLFWGNQSQMNVGSGLARGEETPQLPSQAAAAAPAERCLVIEIPRGSVSGGGEEPSRLSDAQSGPKSPISRLVTTSFRRLLSIRRGTICPEPEANAFCDCEQGAGRSPSGTTTQQRQS